MIAFVGVTLALAMSGAEGTTDKVPEFKADRWYNSAPISLDDLKGKAVLIQVFRTW